ncbi:MAG TPA: hypothetical protein VG166_03040 [Caulobacteraceae bacterium]|nr:hypothetical protein [Caulobacteraceae bacterium]
MKIAIAAAFAALSLAGSAFADARLTATLDSPQGAPAKFIAAHAVWNCEGATCVAQVAPDESFGPTSCRDLAKRVGHVASYATDTKTLDAKGLEKCNVGAAAPAAIGTASR